MGTRSWWARLCLYLTRLTPWTSNMPPTCLLSPCPRLGHLWHHPWRRYGSVTCQHPHSSSLVRKDQVESEIHPRSLSLSESIHGNHRLCASIRPQLSRHVRQRLALRLATDWSLRSCRHDLAHSLPLCLHWLRIFTCPEVWGQEALVLQHHQCHQAETRPAAQWWGSHSGVAPNPICHIDWYANLHSRWASYSDESPKCWL